MLALIIFAVCVGINSQQLPNHHELALMVDEGFRWMDKDHNGILSLAELNIVADKEDLSHDGQITLAEYMAFTNLTKAQAEPMFNAYDVDGDGLLPTDHMLDFLHLLDQNHNGEVNMHEYEQYQVKFIECVYGHNAGHGQGHHGHAADCFSYHAEPIAIGDVCCIQSVKWEQGDECSTNKRCAWNRRECPNYAGCHFICTDNPYKLCYDREEGDRCTGSDSSPGNFFKCWNDCTGQLACVDLTSIIGVYGDFLCD